MTISDVKFDFVAAIRFEAFSRPDVGRILLGSISFRDSKVKNLDYIILLGGEAIFSPQLFSISSEQQ